MNSLIIDRDSLEENYLSYLSGMSDIERDEFVASKTSPKGIILQASSGSSGKNPILIPRSIKDIFDIHTRIINSYLSCYSTPPRKIALLGGVSHAQAAIKMKIKNTEIISFSLKDTKRINEFNPDVISCYPSIARELIEINDFELSNLKGIKLGGERLLDTDLKKLKRRFPNIIILEQYGSTEMPAIAIGCYPNFKKNGMLIQKERFEMQELTKSCYKPIIVKDHFDDLIFRIPSFYNTLDEATGTKTHIFEVRRTGSLETNYYSLMEDLLEAGCINIQIDQLRNEIHYQGSMTQRNISFNDISYKLVEKSLERIPSSNKLPLFKTSGSSNE